jgi:hypothetical protein
MDERTLAVLVAMAKGYLPADDFGSQCAYCYVSEWDCHPKLPDTFEYIDADLQHKPDCPINVARILLKERGTPVNVYKMRYEYSGNPKKKNAVWTQALGSYTIALTPEDAIKEYTHESHRNIQAEFVREVPLIGVGIAYDKPSSEH